MQYPGSAAGAVIRRFLGDRHVVDVTLLHACAGDFHETRPGAHLIDVVAAGVAHRRAHTTHQLVHDCDDTPFICDAPFDALRHEFLQLFRCVLEIPVRGAVRLAHRTDGSHTA